MRLLLNLLWIFLGGGLVIWFQYILGGLILCLTVVGIPFGLQCFKLGGLALLPFGKDIESLPRGFAGGLLGALLNILWIVVAGIWIFVSHLGLAVASAITIIGIPFAVQHLKLAMLALAPFGRDARVGR